MSLLRALLRHDLRQLWRERTVTAVLAITLGAVCYASWSGSQWKAMQLSEFDSAHSERGAAFEREAQQLGALDSGSLDIARAAAAGLPNTVKTELLLPPGPLAELSIGEADLRPSKATVTPVSRAADMFRFYQVDNPALLALGRFDLAFVVIYLMPLLILAMSYSVLSADRESGSLALLLSQPLTAGQLAWARILLRTALVGVAVVLGGVLSWWVFAPEPASTQALPRLLLWSTVVLAYAAFWAALAGLVAAGNRSSDSNALILLLSWATVTLLLPAFIAVAAQSLSPTPSRLEYITAARAAENAANSQGRELVQGYLMDHPELEATQQSAVAPYVKSFILVQQRVDAAVAPVTAQFEQRLDQQQRIGASLAFFSPASLAQATLAEVAGSSLGRHRRFEREARDLRSRWLAALEAPIMAGRRLTQDEFMALSRPDFDEVALASVSRRAALPTLVLLLYTGLAVILARRRFRRFKLAETR